MIARFRDMLRRHARLKAHAAALASCPELNGLLGRRAVNLDTPQLQRFLAGKRVMITGAGGSIGSEVCRQAARFCPEKIILVERSEPGLFEIDRELREKWIGQAVEPCIADVADRSRMETIFSHHRPHIVVHAAAHKHVPMMEQNPGEAIKNNVLGTRSIVDCSLESGVEAFVLVSTDKAVNPTSVMGASKRLAEMIVQSACDKPAEFSHHTRRVGLPVSRSLGGSISPRARFTSVRFGNVIGSSGSVIPIFQRQIATGGPVTVTHADMRRYFMTIPEATQLVMQAGAIGEGGEVFLLDMGQPVLILDLAKQMIHDAGLVEGKDIHIRFTGTRPGEKLYEELASDSQKKNLRPTGHAKINVWDLPPVNATELEAMLQQLEQVINSPPAKVIAALINAIPEYAPQFISLRQSPDEKVHTAAA